MLGFFFKGKELLAKPKTVMKFFFRVINTDELFYPVFVDIRVTIKT